MSRKVPVRHLFFLLGCCQKDPINCYHNSPLMIMISFNTAQADMTYCLTMSEKRLFYKIKKLWYSQKLWADFDFFKIGNSLKNSYNTYSEGNVIYISIYITFVKAISIETLITKCISYSRHFDITSDEKYITPLPSIEEMKEYAKNGRRWYE